MHSKGGFKQQQKLSCYFLAVFAEQSIHTNILPSVLCILLMKNISCLFDLTKLIPRQAVTIFVIIRSQGTGSLVL